MRVLSVVTHRIVLRCADQHVLLAPDRPDGSLVSKEGTLTLARVQVPNLLEHTSGTRLVLAPQLPTPLLGGLKCESQSGGLAYVHTYLDGVVM